MILLIIEDIVDLKGEKIVCVYLVCVSDMIILKFF